MNFRIADTFTDSLARLTGEEQKSVKTTAFDLQIDPSGPGLSFHKLDHARDKNFWSLRVSRDIRLIVHRTASSLLLCYVDHHDRAYRWAERRRLDTHPKTGAAQWVEIRERIEEEAPARQPVRGAGEAVAPRPAASADRPLFADLADDVLLGYGVPPEWLADVRAVHEDGLLDLADHLPSEAAEALLELATGGTPQMPTALPTGADPFSHPDAQRRFRVMSDVAELERALAFPWDKWTIFLHPSQRDLVEHDFNGPARVSGSAGTGKTIVALHRAVHLARKYPDSRVLLTTFSDTLANALRAKVHRLVSNDPQMAERLEVHAMNAVGRRLYESAFGPVQLVDRSTLRSLLNDEAAKMVGLRFSPAFLLGEWDDVVDAWQLTSWEQYRDFKRLGRKTRLSEQQRQTLWTVFSATADRLKADGVLTEAAMFTRLAEAQAGRRGPAFEHALIDEAQDVTVAQLKFLAALAGGRPNGLFFAGDLGQRIFQTPFSWKSLGVDVRGRSRTLHVNYRTSHQIRACADRLLGPEISDVDGNTEDRRGTVSVFNGPVPLIRVFTSKDEEIEGVRGWLDEQVNAEVVPHEIGVFVRSEAQIGRAKAALEATGLPYKILDEQMETTIGFVSICTMHLAKGLEFRAVVVMACDDEVIPRQERIELVGDDADLKEVYDTERHLLLISVQK